MKALRVISSWECLKELIARENIYADQEIELINTYFHQQLMAEIKIDT